MAGHSAGAAPTRYAGIQVQTSALGVQMPIVWGTARCKCNLVWYNNFKSKAQQAASGKGGSTVTGYAYTADLILGLCEGPISAIKTVYVDSNIYTNGAKTALAQAGLSMATGAVGQSVWSYLTSKYPAQAIGYSGLCICYASNYALDSGAGTPQHSFEVVSTTTVSGLPDANPEAVLTDFFTNARYGLPNWGAGLLDATSFAAYSTYCLAANLLVSPVLDQERQASDFLQELMTATNANLAWSEGLLKIVVYGDTAVTGNGATFTPNLTPAYALTDDHLIPQSDGDDALFVDIADQSDAYNIVQFEFLDRTNQYSTAIATANDAANISQYGRRKQDPTTVHVICDPQVAQNAVQIYLQRTLYIRKQFKFTLGWQFALLEPGDIVTLTHAAMGLAAYPVRIIEIDEDEDGTLAITAEDLLAGVSHAPLYATQTSGGYIANQSLDPGGVEANLLLWSQDFTQSAWAHTNITVTGGVTDPYGGATGCSLVTTTASGDHATSQTGVSSFDGANYAYAVFLKPNGRNRASIKLDDGGANSVVVQLDLGAGQIVGESASGTALLTGSSMAEYLATGWYQVTLTAQFPGVTSLVAELYIQDNSGAYSWTGDGSTGVYAWGAQLRQGVNIGAYAATQGTTAGPLIFNPPAVLASGIEAWAAVAGGPNWGGANVWTSVDGTNYTLIGQTGQGAARFGQTTASFAGHADPDTSDTLIIDLGASAGELTGATDATADNGGTLCLLIGATPDASELICFSAATLTNPSRYSLGTYIRRGYLNTPIGSFAAGTAFVRLDSSIFQFPYLATNVLQPFYVKFQSFNLWGQGTQPLSDCVAYQFLPVPVGAASPGASAWTAVGTTLSNNGQATPAIVVTGASDNPSATGIDFEYRVSGTSVWASAGIGNAGATRKEITSVQPSQTYDVSVLYLINGLPSSREIIATGISVGATSTGPIPGSVLLNDSVPGTSKTFTCQAGSYGHVDIVLTGVGGAGSGASTGGKGGVVDYGGSGGATAVKLSFAVTPGVTTFTYTLPAAVGSPATVTATGLSMSAPSGVNATSSGPAAASSAASGGTNNYAGHAGGLVDTWDGGGAANISGGYVDQTTDGQPGLSPGGGGAGAYYFAQSGAGAALQIIART